MLYNESKHNTYPCLGGQGPIKSLNEQKGNLLSLMYKVSGVKESLLESRPIGLACLVRP